MELKRLGHACFRIRGNDLTIYIDPFGLKEPDKADLVLITHSHHDHCSLKDIEKIKTEDTSIVVPENCPLGGNVLHMKPGDQISVKGIGIEGVPAYNIDKPFHPREKQNLGYIMTLEGKRIYHAGDTDFIPEMKAIHCDIALLPVSGTYVMNASEAGEAADTIRPSLVAIPMHYGSGIIGTPEDAEAFKRMTGVHVVFDEFTC